MTPIYSISILLFSLLIACSSGESSLKGQSEVLDCHKKYSSEELREDFQILTQSLRKIHPDLYRVNSKNKIDSKIKEVNGSLSDSLTYLQFLKLMAPLLTDIGCINTQWGHSREFISYRNKNIKLFPIALKVENDYFVITNNYSNNDHIKPGDKIVELNGEKVGDYLQKNYKLLPVDGRVKSLQNRWLESYFPNHHANFWEQPDTFNLKIVNQSGVISTREVASKFKAEIELEKKKEPKRNEQPLQFNIVDSVAFITIKSFNANVLLSKGQDYKSFLDSTFTVVKEKGLPLVIDLKGNSWGNLEYGALLMEYLTSSEFQYVSEGKDNKKIDSTYGKHISLLLFDDELPSKLTSLWQAKENHYSDSLFILSNGWNVNSGGLFCASLRNRENTFFLGEKPGASTFGINSNPILLTLPNTQISIYIPTQQFLLPENNYNNISGIEVTSENEIPFDISKAVDRYKQNTN